MKSLGVLAFGASLAVAACAPTEEAPEAPAPPGIMSGTEPVFAPAAGLQWFDLDPQNAPGVQLATLWGDPAAGAFGAFMRLPAGFASPLHRHTHAMKVVFVSGTYLQAPAGGTQVSLGPGSFLMQPGGEYRHRTSCGAEADCIFFVESEGAFDLSVVEE